jgi:DNA-binding GntR family transcriptional regulator
MATSTEITDRIFQAVLAKQLPPGSRLGEQQLAALFHCSRTIVREALTCLAARGLVTVSARRGWFLVEPSSDEAREAFEARLVIETGLIRNAHALDKAALKRLRAHVASQRRALEGSDIGLRSFLLGDFHVCLAECLGNRLLAETVRDLTARTTLIAMHHQSDDDATHSYAEHVKIVEALEGGDMTRAEQLVGSHLSTWRSKLRIPANSSDPMAQLRRALRPMERGARRLHTRSESNRTQRPARRPNLGGIK